MSRLRADLAAAALGAGWFVVLMLPGWTGGWLLISSTIPFHLVFLVLSSIVTARVARGFITRAEGANEDLGRAIVLPPAGCVVYLTLWNIVDWIAFPRGASLRDSLSLYGWGMVALALSFWVVPYAFVCQRIMRRVLEDPDAR